MSYKNFEQYIEELEELAAQLQEKVQELEKKKLELGLAHELSNNDAQDQVASKLRGYTPTGLNLNISQVHITIADEDITTALQTLFKLQS